MIDSSMTARMSRDTTNQSITLELLISILESSISSLNISHFVFVEADGSESTPTSLVETETCATRSFITLLSEDLDVDDILYVEYRPPPDTDPKLLDGQENAIESFTVCRPRRDIPSDDPEGFDKSMAYDMIKDTTNKQIIIEFFYPLHSSVVNISPSQFQFENEDSVSMPPQTYTQESVSSIKLHPCEDRLLLPLNTAEDSFSLDDIDRVRYTKPDVTPLIDAMENSINSFIVGSNLNRFIIWNSSYVADVIQNEVRVALGQKLVFEFSTDQQNAAIRYVREEEVYRSCMIDLDNIELRDSILLTNFVSLNLPYKVILSVRRVSANGEGEASIRTQPYTLLYFVEASDGTFSSSVTGETMTGFHNNIFEGCRDNNLKFIIYIYP